MTYGGAAYGGAAFGGVEFLPAPGADNEPKPRIFVMPPDDRIFVVPAIVKVLVSPGGSEQQ